MRELERACKLYGQREVARRMKVSATSINLILKGRYPNPKRMLERAKEMFCFDAQERECPILGAIHFEVCEKYREWAKEGVVKKERLYMQVRSYCNECKIEKV
jgi:hypothetical protein